MTYLPSQELWPEQREALAKMAGRKCFALLMAMRTGKTPVVLAEYGQLELDGEVDDLLVVAPAGAYRTWVEAAARHLSQDLLARVRIRAWRSGEPAGQRRLTENFLSDSSGPRIFAVNVEALSKAKSPARDAVLRFLAGGRCYVAVDESTVIKGNSKRTKFVNEKIRPLAARRRILSGLVTPRSPIDLFHQLSFLDQGILGFPSQLVFTKWAAFTEMRDFGGRWLTTVIDKTRGVNGFRPAALEEIRRRIEPHSYRCEFRPKVPTTYSFREVELTPEQRRHYEELRDRATTQLADMSHVTATVVIAQISKMHQVLLGHVTDETGVLKEIPELRTAELLSLLDDHDGKAVVWVSYDHDIRKVAAALAADHGSSAVARFWGGNLSSREEDVARFRTDPACRFMVATPDSGGRGQTWDVADLAVYYSSRDNLEHRDQSEQRTMGRNKERGVDVVDMIARGTVEEKIIWALRKKIDLASAINGDNYREWLV